MSPVSLWTVKFGISHTHVGIGSPVRAKKEVLAEPPNEGLFVFSLFVDIFYLSPILIEPVIVRTNTLAFQPEDDPRFEITITGPQNETAQFKTRGRHAVKKVLAAACKTFGIKYERCVVCHLLQFMFFFINILIFNIELVSSCVFQPRKEAKSRQMNLTVQRGKRCPNAE